MRGGMTRIDGQGAPDQPHSHFQPPVLEMRKTKQIQQLGIILPPGQNLVIEVNRLADESRLMQPDRMVQQFLMPVPHARK
jgi:hypothetical protein